MSTTPGHKEKKLEEKLEQKEEDIEQRQWESPWSVSSVNGLLFLTGLLILAVIVYYTLWPRP